MKSVCSFGEICVKTERLSLCAGRPVGIKKHGLSIRDAAKGRLVVGDSASFRNGERREMPLEIERKFLTCSDAWRQNSVGSTRLRDGLIASNGEKKVRVRIANNQAFLTIKGPRIGITREEFEYQIPLADGEHMLESQCDGLIVTKTRHFVLEEGFTFEVDVYEGVLEGIVIAEAELTHLEQPFPRPDWLGEEVTGQENYRKINMLKDRIARSIT